MSVLQIADYEKMADEIVSEFIENKKDLNTSILKKAQENEFNSEQIKRLVELSNTKAFLKVFSPEKTGEDKNTEFDVADPNKILKEYFANPPEPTKVSHVSTDDFDLDIPDMMQRIRAGVAEVEEPKTEEKSAELIDSNADISIIPEARMKTVMRLRKVAEELLNRIYESEHDYIDELDKTASEFCKLYGPDYAEAEKIIVLRYGDDEFIKHALEDIRKNIRWTAAMYNPSASEIINKVASEETVEVKSIVKMAGFKKVQVKYAEGLKVVNTKLSELM